MAELAHAPLHFDLLSLMWCRHPVQHNRSSDQTAEQALAFLDNQTQTPSLCGSSVPDWPVEVNCIAMRQHALWNFNTGGGTDDTTERLLRQACVRPIEEGAPALGATCSALEVEGRLAADAGLPVDQDGWVRTDHCLRVEGHHPCSPAETARSAMPPEQHGRWGCSSRPPPGQQPEQPATTRH